MPDIQRFENLTIPTNAIPSKIGWKCKNEPLIYEISFLRIVTFQIGGK
jgi:hypothetical protein